MRMPACSATIPNSGGAARNMQNEICANAAILTAAGLSSSWAAADMASGKITDEPAPRQANPSNDNVQ